MCSYVSGDDVITSSTDDVTCCRFWDCVRVMTSTKTRWRFPMDWRWIERRCTIVDSDQLHRLFMNLLRDFYLLQLMKLKLDFLVLFASCVPVCHLSHLLIALILTSYTDHKDLERSSHVEEIQEPIIESLRLYSRKKRPSNPLIFPQLLMKIYDLRTISMRGD